MNALAAMLGRGEAKQPPPKSKAKEKVSGKDKASGKGKTSNMVSSLQDIQRLTTEDMHLEFDRLLAQTQSHLEDKPKSPCAEASDKLMRCLKQSRHQPNKCFTAMEEYRCCVGQATRERVDELAKEYQSRPQQTPAPLLDPIEPPPIVLPEPDVQRRRCWYKPWTWLR